MVLEGQEQTEAPLESRHHLPATQATSVVTPTIRPTAATAEMESLRRSRVLLSSTARVEAVASTPMQAIQPLVVWEVQTTPVTARGRPTGRAQTLSTEREQGAVAETLKVTAGATVAMAS